MTSIEILYHFTCKECKGRWSIAMENFIGAGSREWFCPWCGDKGFHDEGNIPMGREVSSKNDK